MTTDTGRDSTTLSFAAAVRAELSRQGKPKTAIAEVIGVSRPTAYSRLKGDTPFTTEELDKIARFLNTDVYGLIASAELGDRIAASAPEVEQQLPQADPWAQPRRATRRAGAA